MEQEYSEQENPRDWGAWWAAVYGVAQSRTQLKRLSSSSSYLSIYLHTHIHTQLERTVTLKERNYGKEELLFHIIPYYFSFL